MVRKLIQTKKTSIAYAISDSATAMRLVNLLKLDGTSISASDIGDNLRGTFDPGTSREEIFSIDGANVTVNSDGTIDITGMVRGLQEVFPYSTGGFATDHPAGAIVIFGNNPQVYDEKADLINDNEFEGENNFVLLPTSDGGDATEDEQLITYRQALALATGTAAINRMVVAGNGGAVVAAGNLLYLLVTDGEWYPADADTIANVENVILGIAQGAGTDGNPITNGILLFGLDSNQTGLTFPNATYYAGNTAGLISATPGTYEVTVGVSRSATSLLFYPRFNQQLTEDQQDALLGVSGNPSLTNKYETENDTSNAATITASTISFTAATKTIADSGSGFVTANIRAGDSIIVTGTVSNNGTYTIVSVAAGAIVVVEALVNESAGSPFTLTTVTANKLVRYSSSSQVKVPATPVASTDATSKTYVDTTIASATSLISVVTTPVTYSGSTAETNLISVAIPANTLSTNKGVRARLYISGFQKAGFATYNLKLKYGSTTLVTLQSAADATTFGPYSGFIDVLLVGAGTTSSQKGAMVCSAGDWAISGVPIIISSPGTATEDSTGALNLIVTFQSSASNANNKITMDVAEVDKIV